MDNLIKKGGGGLQGTVHTLTVGQSGSSTSRSATLNVPTGAKVLSVTCHGNGHQAYRVLKVTDVNGNEFTLPKDGTYTDGGYTYSTAPGGGYYAWSPAFDSTWKDRELATVYGFVRNDSSTNLYVGVSITYLL